MKSKVLLLILFLQLIQNIYYSETHYTNPVIKKDSPDPSIIKADNGFYYLYSTGEGIYKSVDLINWTYVRQVFEGKPRPSFVDVDSYWAPCITKQGSTYILYFALSVWGGMETSGIGAATADSPEGPFNIIGTTGKLFQSGDVNVKNSIDPFYIEDWGKKYIIWGSWYGIWAIELNNDGISVKDFHTKYQLAGTAFEASYIYKRGKYYYLFASIGNCCAGDKSTYQIVVGRATDFMGPYKAKNGKSMLDNNYSVLLSGNKKFVGPGHNSRIAQDSKGNTWMLYHAYIKGQSNIGRTVCIDQIKWTLDNWPYFDGAGPSSEEKVGPDII